MDNIRFISNRSIYKDYGLDCDEEIQKMKNEDANKISEESFTINKLVGFIKDSEKFREQIKKKGLGFQRMKEK